MHYVPENRGRHRGRRAPLTGRKDAESPGNPGRVGGPQGLYPQGARVPDRAPQPRMQGEAWVIISKEDD